MVKSYTTEEFVDYVNNLKFVELDGLVDFCKAYHAEWVKAFEGDDPEEQKNAYIRWATVIGRFGVELLTFTEAVLILKKQHDAQQNGKAV